MGTSGLSGKNALVLPTPIFLRVLFLREGQLCMNTVAKTSSWENEEKPVRSKVELMTKPKALGMGRLTGALRYSVHSW